MIAVWGVLGGVIIGYFRGGRFENLASLELRGIYWVFGALALQLLIFPTPWWPKPPIGFATDLFHLLSYGFLTVFLVLNRRITPLWGVGLGMGLNLLAIGANGGYMPTRLAALRVAGEEEIARELVGSSDGTFGNVIIMSESTRLNLLGDWIPVPQWLPLASSFSLGDLVLLVSAGWLIQALMVASRSPRGPQTEIHRSGSDE